MQEEPDFLAVRALAGGLVRVRIGVSEALVRVRVRVREVRVSETLTLTLTLTRSRCTAARVSARSCNRGGAAEARSSRSRCGSADDSAESASAPWSGGVGAARCGAAGGGGAGGGSEGDGPRLCSSFCLLSVMSLGRSWSAFEAISLIRLL